MRSAQPSGGRAGHRVAAVILAHADPAQVRRLFGTLPGVDLFLHCDRATSDTVLREMLRGSEDRVHLVPRQRMMLYGWSLVSAELHGLRAALEHSDAGHIVVMSGACYPLLDAQALEAELEAFDGRTLLFHARLPHDPWGTPRNPDGGLWRFNRRFLSLRGRPLRILGEPLRGPRQPIPPDIVLHAGLQWKIYARDHARRLLEVTDRRPDLVRFFSRSFIPDESYVPTILKSPDLVGDVSGQIANGWPWYLEWESTTHPHWLTPDSFDAVRRARAGEGGGEAPHPVDAEVPVLFARKVSSASGELMARIDAELRGAPDPRR